MGAEEMVVGRIVFCPEDAATVARMPARPVHIRAVRLDGHGEPAEKVYCPKCARASGDDWSQCGGHPMPGACPMDSSPHFDETIRRLYAERKLTAIMPGYEHRVAGTIRPFGEISLLMWGIRQKSTGFYLPQLPKGYRFGHTWSDPCFASETTPPRMFHSEAAAEAALRTWLKGKISVREYRIHTLEGPDDRASCTVEPAPDRIPGDMEVVPIRLALPQPHNEEIPL